MDSQQKAVAAYNKNLEGAITNLEAILDALKEKRKIRPDYINWGHVGDAAQAFELSTNFKESLNQ